MPNPEALKLPDPLLVRLYRDGVIDLIERVETEDATRNVVVTIRDRTPMRFLHLADVGWIPDPDQA